MFDFISLVPSLISGIQGIAGTIGKNNAQSQQLQYLLQNSRNLAELTPPNLVALLQPLQQAVWLGQLTPEQYVAQVQQASQLNNIQVDPSLVQAQAQALAQLKEVAESNGLTAQDRAQLQQIATEEYTRARGNRQAAAQQAQERGVSGGGLEQLRGMLADQGAAQSASARGTQVAGLAQQRALQAMQQAGQLAGSMRSQSFDEQARVAAAQDAINRFNTQLGQDVSNANVAARNQAAANDLAQRYALQNFNIDQSNRDQSNRVNAAMNQYQLGLNRLTGQTGANNALASYYGNQATQQGNVANNALSNLGRDLGNYLKPGATPAPTGLGDGLDNLQDRWTYSDPKLKTGVSELSTDEVNDVLNRLTGIKFRYRDPELGQGQRVGISADALDSSPVGSTLVVMGERGKAVDNAKAAQFALAALADINKRLSAVEGN